jgi:hypothetical protein
MGVRPHRLEDLLMATMDSIEGTNRQGAGAQIRPD